VSFWRKGHLGSVHAFVARRSKRARIHCEDVNYYYYLSSYFFLACEVVQKPLKRELVPAREQPRVEPLHRLTNNNFVSKASWVTLSGREAKVITFHI